MRSCLILPISSPSAPVPLRRDPRRLTYTSYRLSAFSLNHTTTITSHSASRSHRLALLIHSLPPLTLRLPPQNNLDLTEFPTERLCPSFLWKRVVYTLVQQIARTILQFLS